MIFRKIPTTMTVFPGISILFAAKGFLSRTEKQLGTITRLHYNEQQLRHSAAEFNINVEVTEAAITSLFL